MRIRIALASDHAGFELKQRLKISLAESGYEVIDGGVNSAESADYPEAVAPAAKLVAAGAADFGVLVCGSGIGVAIVANKIQGVRAVNAHDVEEAQLARRHNNANVITLAGRRLSPDDADKIVSEFLTCEFDGGRHQRRVNQITAMETM